MKNKIVNIVLGVVLVISVVGNVYMAKLFSDTKETASALRNQIATADDQIVALEGQLTNFAQVQGHVADLQGQLTDFEKVQTEVTDLQKQLTESKDLIESLESTITEQNITVASLEEQWENQEQLLLEARANAKKTAQNGNGGVAEHSPNETAPDVPQTTQKPEAQPTVPPNSTGYYDPNDPLSGWPGYEGPREGYVYLPGTGYIEVGGERPYEMPCRQDGDSQLTGEPYPGADM